MSYLNDASWLDKFQEILPLSLQDKVNLLVLEECESTMKSAKEFFKQGVVNEPHITQGVPSPEYLWCYALSQTKGVGRQQREWFSPKAEGMYLSILTYLPIEYGDLNGLSLMIGTSIAKQLEQLNLSVGLKWPNDVLVNGKKIAGILVETFTSRDPNKCHLIIGVGLNIGQEMFPENLNATSVYREIGGKIDYEELCLRIAIQISSDFAVYREKGFGFFIDVWRSMSLMQGVLVKDLTGCVLGRVVDIDGEGALILNGDQGASRIVSYDDRYQYDFNA